MLGLGLFVLALLQASPSERPATTQASQVLNLEDLYEKALRELPEFASYRSTRFIAAGFDDAGDPVDPSPQLLARFADLDGKVRAISKAKRVGKIQDEEGRPGIWHLEDPETGRRARMYYVIVRDRRSDHEVRIEVGFMSGPLGGGGRQVIYRFVDGKWTLERVVYDFVS